MKVLLSLLFVLLPVTSFAQELNEESKRALNQLDSLLELRETFVNQKLERIKRIKAVRPKNSEELLKSCAQLYIEFYSYNPDSAMKYVELSEDIAIKEHRDSILQEIRLGKAHLYIYAGILDRAEEILNNMRPHLKGNSQYVRFYNQNKELSTHSWRYDQANNNLGSAKKRVDMMRLYEDSILMVIDKQDDNYWVHKGWYAVNHKTDVSESKAGLQEDLATKPLSFKSIAMHEYLLAHICKNNEDINGFIQHMTKAGMADIQVANLDMAALNELARELFKLGDIQHAYQYAHLSMMITAKYGDRIRQLELGALYDEIVQAHISQRDEREEMLRLSMMAAICLMLLLIGAIFMTTRLYHKEKKAQKELDKSNTLLQQHNQELERANHQLEQAHQELEQAHQKVEDSNKQLEQLNQQLQEINQQLQAANFAKEGYIGHVFSICSNYINKLDEFRININRKIKAKKLEEIQQLTNTTFMAQQETKELLQTFDTVFLHIYPTFIQDFNLLLEPDFQIVPKDKGALNTELRIYALIRLGITDSVKIAEILHCSSQTIYNYRMKVRSHALLPEKKDFVEAVKNIK